MSTEQQQDAQHHEGGYRVIQSGIVIWGFIVPVVMLTLTFLTWG